MACDYAVYMGTIQLRNVPPALHRELKRRAAISGLSLSAYLLQEFEAIAERPTLQEMMERLGQLPPVKISSKEIVRSIREDRGSR